MAWKKAQLVDLLISNDWVSFFTLIEGTLLATRL